MDVQAYILNEKNLFFNRPAYDLRSPISAMLGCVDLMDDDYMKIIEKRQVLGLMRKSASTAQALVKDMLHLDVSTNLASEMVNLEELLQYCIDLVKNKAGKKNQTIVFKPQPAIINGDKEKLWRVFSNIIINAIKFSRYNSHIVVELVIKENTVLVQVQDNGIGIPDELKNELFNISAKAKRTGTAGEPSFGLGLSISYNISLPLINQIGLNKNKSNKKIADCKSILQ